MSLSSDRPITHALYGGDNENRLKQEILLGIGGILTLKKLGIKKEIYHCNEGSLQASRNPPASYRLH